MRRHPIRALLVTVLGMILAIGVLVTPAVAQPTISGDIGDTGTLVANGPAVLVTVTYTCSSDALSAALGVQVSQRVGGHRLAQGGADLGPLICDDTAHTTTLQVVASGDNTFRSGDALAVLFLQACDREACTNTSVSETIRIKKK